MAEDAQKEKLYTEQELFLFAGYAKGCLDRNPESNIGDIHREWLTKLDNMKEIIKQLEN
jgi:hypothetical protein